VAFQQYKLHVATETQQSLTKGGGYFPKSTANGKFNALQETELKPWLLLTVITA
jgi:hypothetical protein